MIEPNSSPPLALDAPVAGLSQRSFETGMGWLTSKLSESPFPDEIFDQVCTNSSKMLCAPPFLENSFKRITKVHQADVGAILKHTLAGPEGPGRCRRQSSSNPTGAWEPAGSQPCGPHQEKKRMRPGNVVDSQPSNSRGEKEHAGEVANVSLCPCKAGLGQIS